MVSAERREYARRRYLANKERLTAQQRDYRKANPDIAKSTARRHWLKKKYGLTEAKYSAMLDAQGGVCYICKRPPGSVALAVDHNHITGEVRKLLCAKCNQALGMMDEVADRLRAAAAYLEEHDNEYSTY